MKTTLGYGIPLSVDIETDEDGFHLLIEFDDRTFDFVLDEPEKFYDSVKASIGPWLRERDEARAEMIVGTPAYREWQKASGAFACDPDESGGYDISDPKHSDFHSVHADIWDSREGK